MALGTGLCAGCAGYRFGSQSLYPANVRTVHVPMFQSESFRPDLGERLTEAVVKQIELKTGYKVVPRERADTILDGRIVVDNKRVAIETINGDPRQTDLLLRVQVSWTNRQGQQICPETVLALPDALVEVEQGAILVPEVGHSVAASQQQAIERLAEQIVAMMEIPW